MKDRTPSEIMRGFNQAEFDAWERLLREVPGMGKRVQENPRFAVTMRKIFNAGFALGLDHGVAIMKELR